MPTVRTRTPAVDVDVEYEQERRVPVPNLLALRRARCRMEITGRSATPSMLVRELLERAAAHVGILAAEATRDRRDGERFITVLAPVIDECLVAANGDLGMYCRLIRQRQRDDRDFAAAWNTDSNW